MTEVAYPDIVLPDSCKWERLLELCSGAGQAIVRHYREPSLSGKLREKSDDSPLTRADLESHRMICAGLRELTPSVPILSEESDREAIAGRRDWEQFWMVDPLDGTREFLERSGEFTINLALIRGHRPVAGLIYEPLAEAAAVGAVGGGAFYLRRSGSGWESREIRTSPLGREQIVVLASRRHRNERLRQTLDFLAADRVVTRRDSGSALKFIQLACGTGDCYPRFSPCSEWDVAAGDAIVAAAGGMLVGLDGVPPRYNARESLLAPPFLAVGDWRGGPWVELLAALNRGLP